MPKASPKPVTPVVQSSANFRTLLDNATPGPYFVSHDDGGVDDFLAHKGIGLALVDTGRSGDWPIAHFSEWPTANFIARCNPETMRLVFDALLLSRHNLESPNEREARIRKINKAICTLNREPEATLES